MKPTPEEMDLLLEDILPQEAAVNRDVLLALVRHEHARRRRRRALLLALPLVLLGAWLWRPHTAFRLSDAPAQMASGPKPLSIKWVDDKQLLDLLKDVPAALMQWPDGRQALLVLAAETDPQL